jgi:hypothetical protein
VGVGAVVVVLAVELEVDAWLELLDDFVERPARKTPAMPATTSSVIATVSTVRFVPSPIGATLRRSVYAAADKPSGPGAA